MRQDKSSHPTFPHESTGDQCYAEDQFESYRRLGRDIGREVFAALKGEPSLVSAVMKIHPPDRLGVPPPGEGPGRIPPA